MDLHLKKLNKITCSSLTNISTNIGMPLGERIDSMRSKTEVEKKVQPSH